MSSRTAVACVWLIAALALHIIGCRTDAARLSDSAPSAQRPPAFTFDHGGIIRADPSRKELALIFTGGSYGEGTGPILDALAERHIRAAFFVTGEYLAAEAHRALLRRMIDEGHYVGPHSDAHLLYCDWEDRGHTLVTEEQFRSDLEKNIADLRQFGALPDGQTIWFIPPYEWFNADQVRWSRDLGVRLFNFTPGSGSNRDWIPEGERGFVSSADILRGILEYEQKDPHGLNGFLLLLHLGSQRQDKMHLQVGPLLDELTRRGYGFVRVDELLDR